MVGLIVVNLTISVCLSTLDLLYYTLVYFKLIYKEFIEVEYCYCFNGVLMVVMTDVGNNCDGELQIPR